MTGWVESKPHSGAQSRRLAVAELADRQHGFVAHWQLMEIGLGRRAIQYESGTGWLRRVARGVYAVGHTASDIYGRVMAAVLWAGPGALASHGAAAWVWGIGSAGGTTIDVTRVGRGRLRWGHIVVHHVRSIEDEERAMREDVPVTSLARTLLDCAATKQPRVVHRMIEEADRRGLFDLREAERTCRRRHRGARPLAAILTDFKPEPITKSELERLFLELCGLAGLPLPETNAFVEGYEVDAVWRGQRFVVELDSRAHHLNPTAFERDRVRDIDLQLAGYRVVRITWARLRDEPERVVAELTRFLATA